MHTAAAIDPTIERTAKDYARERAQAAERRLAQARATLEAAQLEYDRARVLSDAAWVTYHEA